MNFKTDTLMWCNHCKADRIFKFLGYEVWNGIEYMVWKCQTCEKTRENYHRRKS